MTYPDEPTAVTVGSPAMTAEPRKPGARKADPVHRRATKSSAKQRAADPGHAPSFWHRSHPVFTPLAGFFVGMAFILIVPTTFAALLRFVLGEESSGGAYWLILLTLLIPLGLVIVPATRRFGAFMWMGIVLTALVVIGVVAAVWWVLTNSGDSSAVGL